MFKKRDFAFLILMLLICSATAADTVDYSVMLGFNGLFKENSWAPLIIRLSNSGSSMSGTLTVITDNSGTATKQMRSYSRPIDLPAGSDKALSFVIPIGHHNRDLTMILRSDDEIFIDEKISLKQRGIRGHFVLVVSPYPDLSLPPTHGVLENRSITYPHPDNLPENSQAYDGVEIISIHREFFDRLSNSQFEAITGWVSTGGILAVWGGKSPSSEARDYLPAEIVGLKRQEDSGIMMNRIIVRDEKRLTLSDGFEAGAMRQSGAGSIYFFPFDYSGELRDWEGISEIWDILNHSVPADDPFRKTMDKPYLLEDYIKLFDNSEFNYLDRMNVALILFLSASISVSLLIFIRLRRKSDHIYRYIAGFFFILILLSTSLYAILFNSTFRYECFAIDVNLVYQLGETENASLYKDLLIGSTGKSKSQIILPESTEAILKREDNEELSLVNRPEVILDSVKLNQWTSRTFRLEGMRESICDISYIDDPAFTKIQLRNKSDYILHNNFILYKGEIYPLENILPEQQVETALNDGLSDSQYHRNPLLNSIAELYLEPLIEDDHIIFCGFINESLNPVEFTNKTWRKKTATLVISRLEQEGEERND